MLEHKKDEKEYGQLLWQLQGASAEKKGDIVEMWLGYLDLCVQVGEEIDIFKGFNPEAWYFGLENAIQTFAQSSRSTMTPNAKRNKTPDSYMREEERHFVDHERSSLRAKGHVFTLMTKNEAPLARKWLQLDRERRNRVATGVEEKGIPVIDSGAPEVEKFSVP